EADFKRVLVPLHDVILDALQFLRHEGEWRGITLSQVFSAASSNVLADRTSMHQLIVNLAVNAMQAVTQVGAAERRITARTSSPDVKVLVSPRWSPRCRSRQYEMKRRARARFALEV